MIGQANHLSHIMRKRSNGWLDDANQQLPMDSLVLFLTPFFVYNLIDDVGFMAWKDSPF